MRPLVSVVMPAFNASNTIGNAIASIVEQTIPDWELIIVDDGSEDSDKTIRVIERFEKWKEKIRYVRINHQGLVRARNHGNELAQAPIIAMQDADDLSMPDRLEKSLAAMRDNDVLVHSLYVNMWDTHWNAMSRSYKKVEDIDPYRLREEQYIPGVCLFRKELWERKPYRMETQYSFDWMMHLDWVLSGAKYVTLNVGLYEYVRHANSASQMFEASGLRKQSFDEIKRILKEEYDQ